MIATIRLSVTDKIVREFRDRTRLDKATSSRYRVTVSLYRSHYRRRNATHADDAGPSGLTWHASSPSYSAHHGVNYEAYALPGRSLSSRLLHARVADGPRGRAGRHDRGITGVVTDAQGAVIPAPPSRLTTALRHHVRGGHAGRRTLLHPGHASRRAVHA